MFPTGDINHWLGSIIEHSFDGIYITDGRATTIMVNKAYETITGLRRSEVLGKNMRELVDKQIISSSGSLRVLETGEPVTLHQEFKTGRKALITSTPIFGANHKIDMIVTNVRDLTEIYNLKATVETSEGQKQLLLKELEHMKSEMLKLDLVVQDSRTMEVMRLADKVRELDTIVMLLGETGVGKDVFAKYICQNSTRRDKPFIKINCGAIPENLMESEFFGYEGGAFTDADKRGKIGLFEVADTGTIFLDEIGELPLSMQVKLLRVLQDQEITRVGSHKPRKIDVRILAATNRNLEEMVKEGTFREDLYYRLMVFPIHIPPLRDRIRDIEPMVSKFTESLNQKYGWKKSFTPDSLQVMEEYSWPGNIRELKNVVERAIIISSGDQITPEDLPLEGDHDKNKKRRTGMPHISNLPEYIHKVELYYINEAYKKYGNVRDAADSLGISPATFVRKRKKSTD
ncbi:MAG: sigma 54-interacting transcriptional regulator [Lachnospiraceae bacterium]|nr:sigma 54-interacting transcriptional regulator [Lachnospiraceae bacterium]